MIRPLLGVLLLAATWTAAAADTVQYKVELIIFENLDPAALQAEHWPADPGTPPLNNAMELNTLTAATPSTASPSGPAAAPSATSSATGTSPGPAVITPALGATSSAQIPPSAASVTPRWRWLDPSELTLNGVEQKLSNSKRYRPLLHIGWIQPLDSSDQGTPVHLYDGLKPQQNNDTHDVAAPPAVTQVLAPPLDAAEPPAASEANTVQAQNTGAQAPPHVIDGTFTLRRGRFLHVDADIGYRDTYTPEGTAPDSGAMQPVTLYVRMAQSRRIRGDELHYLDHPLFGVLFVVSPYPPAAADVPAK